ncbi:hypothetical protein A3Q56_07026 [Intoshia linei]|uniref:SEC14-like protein 1 n=1 Tax=Intoshia linei TaxID=1819745 RepID=A0A177AV52_9BILA|nr:hypothetical protein A3Q56_07026 [Intoshia linei]
MVQKYTSPVRVYKCPFELVMKAYQMRFPTCDMIPIFLGCDITEQKEASDGSTIVTNRKCKINFEAPYILRKLSGVQYLYFMQSNALDRKNRTLDITAVNESFSSRIKIIENCRYSVHPNNDQYTCFEQNAELDIISFFGFEKMCEKLAMKQYLLNIKKGKEIIEHYIDVLAKQGITQVPIWIPFKIKVDSLKNNDDEGIHSDIQTITSNMDTINTQNKSSMDTVNTHILDTDYIKKRLGNLSLSEESSLVQFIDMVKHSHPGKCPKETNLLRFLKANSYNVDKSFEVLTKSLIWRKLHGIDQMLLTYKVNPILEKFFSGCWHFNDKEGRPIYILRLGNLDLKGIVKSVGLDEITKYFIYTIEEGIRRAESASENLSKPVTNNLLIIDCDNLSMRNLWKPIINYISDILQTIQNNYPEMLHRVYFLRVPRLFPILWSFMELFIDADTFAKFYVSSGDDHTHPSNGLAKFIDERIMPTFIGGNCECAIPEGGIIPKSQYMGKEEYEKIQNKFRSLYKTVEIHKEGYEYILQIVDSNCMITWDFDVLKGNIIFGVYKCTNKSNNEFKDSTKSNERLNYSLIDKPTYYRHGDSVQGTRMFICPGKYVLIWDIWLKNDEHLTNSPSSSKAKIMYHTEILSDTFSNSLTSLTSSNSIFSQISQNKINLFNENNQM